MGCLPTAVFRAVRSWVMSRSVDTFITTFLAFKVFPLASKLQEGQGLPLPWYHLLDKADVFLEK